MSKGLSRALKNATISRVLSPITGRAKQCCRDGRPLARRLTTGGRLHQRLRPVGGRGVRSCARSRPEECAHSHQIIRRMREGEDQRHLLPPAMMQLAQAADGLAPPEAFLYSLRLNWLTAYPAWRSVRPSIALTGRFS